MRFCSNAKHDHLSNRLYDEVMERRGLIFMCLELIQTITIALLGHHNTISYQSFSNDDRIQLLTFVSFQIIAPLILLLLTWKIPRAITLMHTYVTMILFFRLGNDISSHEQSYEAIGSVILIWMQTTLVNFVFYSYRLSVSLIIALTSLVALLFAIVY